MEQEFNQATQKFNNLTAVYVTQRTKPHELFGHEIPSGEFIVGVCCAEGAEIFEINAGISRENGEKIARGIIAHHPDLQLLTSKAPQPFVALDPDRIADIHDVQSRLVFVIKDTGHSFSVQHEDAHRASIDSYLLANKLIQMRGLKTLSCAPHPESRSPQSKDPESKAGRSLPSSRP